ncbi:MAG: hypothetical protein QMD04_02660 [Anaerolineales bacterium]|nr:hypothetical protein [Anaerolineales bacterium]
MISCPHPFWTLRLGTAFTLIASLLAALTACSGLLPAPLPPSPTAPWPTLTATFTPTIAWFPPTATNTPLPMQIVIATPEERPGLGEVLFSDHFDAPELWDTAVSNTASAIVERNRLTLAISKPGTAILSLRQEPLLRDFYAEMTASLSLCRGRDQYGLLVRVQAGGDYYRYAVNCNGQARLERVRSGQPYPLQDWLLSGDAPPGAPGDVKMGVWAVGSEMRFFLNDRHQFTVHDPLFKQGTLGVFVKSEGASPLTVSFLELIVYAVSCASPTATP